MFHGGDGVPDLCLEEFPPHPALGRLIGHHGALGPGVGQDKALLLQQPVGLLDGVGVYPQQGRHNPPGGEFLPVGDGASGDAQLDVAQNLLVNGNPVGQD